MYLLLDKHFLLLFKQKDPAFFPLLDFKTRLSKKNAVLKTTQESIWESPSSHSPFVMTVSPPPDFTSISVEKSDDSEAVLLSNATKRRHDEAMFVRMLSWILWWLNYLMEQKPLISVWSAVMIYNKHLEPGDVIKHPANSDTKYTYLWNCCRIYDSRVWLIHYAQFIDFLSYSVNSNGLSHIYQQWWAFHDLFPIHISQTKNEFCSSHPCDFPYIFHTFSTKNIGPKRSSHRVHHRNLPGLATTSRLLERLLAALRRAFRLVTWWLLGAKNGAKVMRYKVPNWKWCEH